MVLGSTESLTEMSTRNLSGRWGGERKGGQELGLTTLGNSRDNCLEISEPERPEALRDCTGIALPFTSIMRQGRHNP